MITMITMSHQNIVCVLGRKNHTGVIQNIATTIVVYGTLDMDVLKSGVILILYAGGNTMKIGVIK